MGDLLERTGHDAGDVAWILGVLGAGCPHAAADSAILPWLST